ncbi:MAG TPA: dihydrofolate reductase family protein [Polyangiaceae bacterium]|nr:dihydrofolate reductase family protein [Polyangiaceae bacterium]
MRTLSVYNMVSLDGYIADAGGDMSWAHSTDPEFQAFGQENARGGGALLFGRKTYDMMAAFWPTEAAKASAPVIAERMNAMPKYVFSRTLREASWGNTTLLEGDPGAVAKRLKQEDGPDIVVMGSGSIVAQLTRAGVVDRYTLVINPILLGGGLSMFRDLERRTSLKLEKVRTFPNGYVVLWYARA